MDPSYLATQPPEFIGIPRKRIALHDVFLVYRQQFRRWFFVTAPTSLIAAGVLFLADQRVRDIFGGIPRGEIGHHFAEVLEAGAIRFASFFISWFLGCFALAAIAGALSQKASDNEGVWRHDDHQGAREHFWQIVLIAAFTFLAFLAGAAAILVVELAAFRVTDGWAHFARYNYSFVRAGFVLVGAIVSWFGMAIPLVIRGDVGTWAAIKRSVKISGGYEMFLLLLVAESLVGSYVAWYATHYGLSLIFPASIRFTEWYGWAVYIAFILASAAVQPPMFIGFSLLAEAQESASDLFPCA